MFVLANDQLIQVYDSTSGALIKIIKTNHYITDLIAELRAEQQARVEAEERLAQVETDLRAELREERQARLTLIKQVEEQRC